MSRHLLVVGAQRCGTTYTHDVLAAHPRIAMARPARPEPKVFLSDELTARGPEWYRRTFFAHASDESVLGEKSTSYLEYAAAADRAAACLGDPLVLVVLRDPVRRAMSHWAFTSDSGLETRDLAEALEANLDGPLPWDRELTSVSPYAYLERGRYADYLPPWLDRFGDDVVVVFLEELAADPDRVGGLYARLGVDDRFRPDHPGRPVNRSERPVSELPVDLESRLRGYFQESDRTLVSLLGRELPWTLTSAGRAAPR